MADELRLKVLDCNRKAILNLPSAAVHLFFVYWMHESEEGESYLSLTAIERVTGWSRNTVIKWRNYLIDNGWLVKTGGTAAQRYSKPTNGAWMVPIVRVDDPVAGGGSSNNEPPPPDRVVHKLSHPNCEPKVSDSVSDSVSCSASSSDSDSDSTKLHYPTCGCGALFPSGVTSLREVKNQKKLQKQQPHQKHRSQRLASPVKWLTKYDSPKPDEFDDWSQVARVEWCEAHRLNKPNVSVEAKPEPEPVILPVSKPQEPALPNSTATPKVRGLSAMPTPPNSAPPPKPAEPIDYRLKWMKMLAGEIYTFQSYSHGTVKPPTDWETAWLADTDALVKLTEGKGSMLGTMLRSVIALSQVCYATKYTTPRAILGDVVPLGREVVELITQGTLEEVRNAYHEVVCPPKQQSDEDESDDKPTMWIDPEVKAAQEHRDFTKRIARWNTWLDANTHREKSA